jgi:hypothetical protein
MIFFWWAMWIITAELVVYDEWWKHITSYIMWPLYLGKYIKEKVEK